MRVIEYTIEDIDSMRVADELDGEIHKIRNYSELFVLYRVNDVNDVNEIKIGKGFISKYFVYVELDKNNFDNIMSLVKNNLTVMFFDVKVSIESKDIRNEMIMFCKYCNVEYIDMRRRCK